MCGTRQSQGLKISYLRQSPEYGLIMNANDTYHDKNLSESLQQANAITCYWSIISFILYISFYLPVPVPTHLCLPVYEYRYIRSVKEYCIGILEESVHYIYSLLSIPQISRDWAKYVELSVVRGNQIMTYTYHLGAK